MIKYSIHNKIKSILKMLNKSKKEEYYKYYKTWKLSEKFYIDYKKANLIQENVINKLTLLTKNLQKGKI
tara:strand:+ start:503 stop:709 length:207 start_codon:yes stop_codon:yes gene_type:complete